MSHDMSCSGPKTCFMFDSLAMLVKHDITEFSSLYFFNSDTLQSECPCTTTTDKSTGN